MMIKTKHMNTPLMELIEWVNAQPKHYVFLLTDEIKSKATELLEKEREMIEQAFDSGLSDKMQDTPIRTGSDYYTKTFTNESK